jgi:hypothetical protein
MGLGKYIGFKPTYIFPLSIEWYGASLMAQFSRAGARLAGLCLGELFFEITP